MAKRVIDIVTAVGVFALIILTLQVGLRLMAFHQ